jgi:MoaA/NifB/PqqE/SkfB family radical SAM enzyme
MIDIYKKMRVFYQWTFTDVKTTAAIDITNRCNLKCTHCYWWKEEQPAELDDEAMIGFMKEQRRAGRRLAILYGGEPMLRPEVCMEAGRIFDYTIVFTNGTQGFPDINARWLLSLDGTREVHDSIRGNGVYDTVMENLDKNPTRKPIVHITITQENRHNIKDFVEEMSTKRIRGIGFSFYTPHRGMDESGLFIPIEERVGIMDDILLLRKRHGKLVGFTEAMAHQFNNSGAFTKWNSLQTCAVKEVCSCFNADGTPKPCIYGKDADCSRCGCTAVAVYRAAVKEHDIQSMLTASSLMV